MNCPPPETILEKFSATPAPLSVLELAAGTGIVSRCLRDALPDECELLVTDLNEPMLEVARQKFQDDEDVCFQPVDAMELPFDDDSFDALVCQFGVMFFPEKEQSYAEALRVLKPGGHYLLNVWDSWAHNPFAQIVHNVVAGFFPEDPPGFYKVPFSYHDMDAIREALTQAGFSDVTIEQLPVTSSIPSAKTFARGLVFGNPLFEEVTSRGGDPEEVCTAVTEAIQEQLGERMTIQAIVVDASKDW